MRRRTWSTIIAINVILAAAVTVTILYVWDRSRDGASSPASLAPTDPPAEAALPTAPPPTLVAATDAPSATPPPLLYIVQPGDTLGAIGQAYDVSIDALMAANGITDPNVLRAGQTLVIPGHAGPTSTPAPLAEPADDAGPTLSPPTRLPTLTPAGPSVVEIGQVTGSGDLAAETVVVRNRGGPADLEAWTISDAAGNSFFFPALTLFDGAEVRVHSTAGHSTPVDLYWSRMEPAWSGGELITLRDGAGEIIDTYVVP